MATGRVPTTANSPLTAKGDLFTYSTAPARLAVGLDGEQIVADSSTSTGLRYQGSMAAGKNVAINGNFDIWQRGTSFTGIGANAYSADRWLAALNYSGGTTNITQDTSVPNGNSKFSLKMTHATASTSSISDYSIRQYVEGANVLALIGKTVTLSFWVRSNKTGNFGYRLYPENVTGAADVNSTFSISASATWEKKTITTSALFGSATAFTGALTDRGLWIQLGFNANGNGQSSVASGDYIQFDQIQLEMGSVGTTFTMTGGTIQGELAACQRYFQRLVNGADSSVENFGVFQCTSSTTGVGGIQFFVPMRTAPTMSISAAVDFQRFDASGGGLQALTAVSFLQTTTRRTRTDLTWTSGTTAGNATFVLARDAAARLDASAEL
jgi:hypothetical protein